MADIQALKALVDKVDQVLYRVSQVIACAAVAALIVVTFLDVMGRHFASAIPGASEIISTILAVGFFAGMSLVIRADGHIKVGIAVGKYPAWLQQAEKVLTWLACITAMALIVWLMYVKGLKLASEGSISKFIGFPLAYIAYVLTALALIALLVNIFEGYNKVGSAEKNSLLKKGEPSK